MGQQKKKSLCKMGRPPIRLTPKQLDQLSVLLNSSSRFSRTDIATQLGISRTTLYRRLLLQKKKFAAIQEATNGV